MDEIKLHFAEELGAIRPMHAVNNGPVYKFTEDQRITNIDAFRDAGIPYARTHDASFYSSYGGEHTIDVHAIFPDFSKDENDPASYDFVLTDEYLKVMVYAGVEPFYRLGSKIEHWPKKYGTLPPPDFKKWAAVCEHIIAHYTEGWADGFRYKITYWEIWNEPDLGSDETDPVNKKCWGGTKEQFCELFEITAKHLKNRFPSLKIGGPAVCYPVQGWVDDFLSYCRDRKVPMDFFSWHCYAKLPSEITYAEKAAREILDKFGFTEAESILDEWNYVKGWVGDEWVYSLRTEKNLKGAAFIASVIEASAYQPLDLLMYYDARPCGMNGLFSTDFVCDKLKGYYPFWMFKRLYDLGRLVAIDNGTNDSKIICCATKNDTDMAFMLTYYDDIDVAEEKKVCVSFDGMADGAYEVEYRLLDAGHDADPVRSETIRGVAGKSYLTIPLFGTYLVTMKKVD